MPTKFFPHYSFRLIPLCALLFILAACGDNSPFDEDYWEETNAEDEQTREEESNRPRAFTATLAAISQNVGNITGAANIRIEQDTVTTTTELIDVPQSLMAGQRSITSLTCEQVAAQAQPPVVVNGTSLSKTYNTVENGTREALILEMTQADPQSRGSLDLAGKSYVIKAYVQIVNSPLPQQASLIPIACGLLQVDEQTENEGSTVGVATGGDNSGTISGTVGTTAGGIQETFEDSSEF